jgi:hypothetical protein
MKTSLKHPEMARADQSGLTAQVDQKRQKAGDGCHRAPSFHSQRQCHYGMQTHVDSICIFSSSALAAVRNSIRTRSWLFYRIRRYTNLTVLSEETIGGFDWFLWLRALENWPCSGIQGPICDSDGDWNWQAGSSRWRSARECETRPNLWLVQIHLLPYSEIQKPICDQGESRCLSGSDTMFGGLWRDKKFHVVRICDRQYSRKWITKSSLRLNPTLGNGAYIWNWNWVMSWKLKPSFLELSFLNYEILSNWVILQGIDGSGRFKIIALRKVNSEWLNFASILSIIGHIARSEK